MYDVWKSPVSVLCSVRAKDGEVFRLLQYRRLYTLWFVYEISYFLTSRHRERDGESLVRGQGFIAPIMQAITFFMDATETINR